jgi:hypothetical protein
VNLAFVVCGAAAIEIAVTRFGKKRRRGPEIQRIGGLNIIVSVEKDRGLAGSFEGFRVNERIETGGNDLDRFETGGAEMVGDPTGGAFDVRFMLAFRAYRWDAKEIAQLVKMLLALTFDNFSKVHGQASGAEKPLINRYEMISRKLRHRDEREPRSLMPSPLLLV